MLVDDRQTRPAPVVRDDAPPGRLPRQTPMSGRILIVDDDDTTCELLEAMLAGDGYEAVSVGSAAEALERVEAEVFDVVLTDLNLGGMDGVELCGRLATLRPDLPVVVVTGYASVDAAVGALRAGAYDFLTKPIDTKLLGPVVVRATERGHLSREVQRLRRALAESERFGALIGKSPAMLRVFDLVVRVAEAEASVLITGESGTGKELVARSIHERSPRSDGPFVALNCAAVPASLVESELFGHAKGAFTGAREDRVGLFVRADGGTLFLDEVGELPPEIQPKLLRALQERRVLPVGGNEEQPFDARVITATNRNLEEEVEEGRFREDLLYRLDVVRLELPPLRARGRDILLLAQAFVERFSARADRDPTALGPEVAEKLLAYDWPGNVRELENCIERAVALAKDAIVVADLPAKVREHVSDRVVVDVEDPAEMPTLDELERRYIARVLRALGGNKTQAAKVLGLDRRTLYRRLEKHGIQG